MMNSFHEAQLFPAEDKHKMSKFAFVNKDNRRNYELHVDGEQTKQANK